MPEDWEGPTEVSNRHEVIDLTQAASADDAANLDVVDLTSSPRQSSAALSTLAEDSSELERMRTPYGELHRENRVAVFTDGASLDNQSWRFRRAGFGAFWGRDHPFNVSEALSGHEQTNNRAELDAVVRVLELEVRPIEIRTDSASVHQGLLHHLATWRARGWKTRSKKPTRNGDLWVRVADLISQRQAGTVSFIQEGAGSYESGPREKR